MYNKACVAFCSLASFCVMTNLECLEALPALPAGNSVVLHMCSCYSSCYTVTKPFLLRAAMFTLL